MSKTKTKPITIEEVKRKIALRRRQIAFDNYSKKVQDVMTRLGLNPYETDTEERIVYREFNVTIERK